MLTMGIRKQRALAFLVSLFLCLAPQAPGHATITETGFQMSEAQNVQIKTSTLVASIASSPNAILSSGGTVLVRANETYQVEMLAAENLMGASGAKVEVALSGAELSAGSKLIAIDGGTPSASYPNNLKFFADEDGLVEFTLRTVGFEVGDTVVINASFSGGSAAPMVLKTTAPTYSLVSDFSVFAAAPGDSTRISYSLNDQWGVALNDPGYRVRLSQEIDGFTFEKSAGEAPVVAGVATFDLRTLPSSLDRSALLTGELQRFDFTQSAWISLGSKAEPVRINVTDDSATFAQFPQSTVAASVSYLPGKVKWVSISGTSTLPGAEIQVSGGEALVFRLGPNSPVIAKELSLRGSADGSYSFEVASLRDGIHTVIQKTRDAEAKTTLVVAPASGTAGKSIVFDRSSLTPGSATRITGTLLDANGNVVQTSGAADMIVSWNGAGFPVGIGKLETDAAGKFSFVVLVPASERGSGTVTATYRPQGASTDLGNITVSQTLVVEKDSDAVSALVSSSNGQWVVRVDNASGLEVSVRVGTRWLKSTASSDSFTISGKAQAGTTVPVRVWVAGDLITEQKITIK